MEKGDGHYVQNNRLVVGRNIYQKPMPKQDKGGGIIPTAELARFCPYKQQATGLQNAAPLLALSVPRSLSTRGKPALFLGMVTNCLTHNILPIDKNEKIFVGFIIKPFSWFNLLHVLLIFKLKYCQTTCFVVSYKKENFEVIYGGKLQKTLQIAYR